MLQPLRYLHDCSDCFRLERLPGGACTHWKAPPFHGARQERSLVFAPGRPRPHKHADQKVLICNGPRRPTKPDAEERFFLSPPKSSFILRMEVGVRW